MILPQPHDGCHFLDAVAAYYGGLQLRGGRVIKEGFNEGTKITEGEVGIRSVSCSSGPMSDLLGHQELSGWQRLHVIGGFEQPWSPFGDILSTYILSSNAMELVETFDHVQRLRVVSKHQYTASIHKLTAERAIKHLNRMTVANQMAEQPINQSLPGKLPTSRVRT